MATINGTANDDYIITWPEQSENDTISALGGNDTVYGYGGFDLFYGGDGHDSITGYYDNDTIYGGLHNDTLYGEGGVDLLIGEDGDDLLRLGAWSSGSGGEAYGGAGNDFLSAAVGSEVTLDGGDGKDNVYLSAVLFAGPNGDAFIDFSGTEKIVRIGTSEMTLVDVEEVSGFLTDGAHTIIGGSFNDSFTLYDVTQGSDVDLGAGNDTLWAEPDVAHTLEGGSGIDVLRLDSGPNGTFHFTVDAQTGEVTHDGIVEFSGFENYMIVSEAVGRVTFGGGDDSFFGGNGFDSVLGGLGNDSITTSFGNDTVRGGDGNDSAWGLRGDDLLHGDDGDDFLFGGGETDVLDGSHGKDRLNSGKGNDLIFGGDGNDSLLGHFDGNDTLTGGAGADKFINGTSSWGNHLITDFESGVDRLHLKGSALSPHLDTGYLADDELTYGAADQPHAQFILIYDAPEDETRLVFDDNGTSGGGGYTAVMRFEGNVTLDAQDILII